MWKTYTLKQLNLPVELKEPWHLLQHGELLRLAQKVHSYKGNKQPAQRKGTPRRPLNQRAFGGPLHEQAVRLRIYSPHPGSLKAPMRVWKGTVFTPMTPLSS